VTPAAAEILSPLGKALPTGSLEGKKAMDGVRLKDSPHHSFGDTHVEAGPYHVCSIPESQDFESLLCSSNRTPPANPEERKAIFLF